MTQWPITWLFMTPQQRIMNTLWCGRHARSAAAHDSVLLVPKMDVRRDCGLIKWVSRLLEKEVTSHTLAGVWLYDRMVCCCLGVNGAVREAVFSRWNSCDQGPGPSVSASLSCSERLSGLVFDAVCILLPVWTSWTCVMFLCVSVSVFVLVSCLYYRISLPLFILETGVCGPKSPQLPVVHGQINWINKTRDGEKRFFLWFWCQH